jgi:hypothetical protein
MIQTKAAMGKRWLIDRERTTVNEENAEAIACAEIFGSPAASHPDPDPDPDPDPT